MQTKDRSERLVARGWLLAVATGLLFAGSCSGTQPLWYRTCGQPICQPDAGAVDSGLAQCTSQQVGQVCVTVGQECDPGVGCGVLLECANSDPTKNGCPISRRSAKRDIEYLTPAELEKEAQEVLAIPLARYRYRDEVVSRAPHLGFIIDDVGPQECVDWEAGRVDLYGYTSMAVAALQRQEVEIRELRARVREVERKASVDGVR
jgi:hypothetical protein